ncbi:MAG: DUF4783 domain-containing protein [Microscillaceae bacterium]|nr:DUF4783 domain-containing protein [Microscillaceae bacterium]
MKRLRNFWSVCLLVTGLIASAQAQTDVIQQFATQIKSGNANALMSFLGEEIKLSISVGEEKQTSGKVASGKLLESFLAAHPLSDIKFEHQGTSGTAGFAIGHFTDREGKRYRIVLKTDGQKIEKIDLSEEN